LSKHKQIVFFRHLPAAGFRQTAFARWRDSARFTGGAPDLHGAISILAWTGALACGRLIAFAGN
jgi:hypothetical protein